MFTVYNNLENPFNKHLKEVTKCLLKFYKILGFRVYNTLVNYFNKHLKKCYKMLVKML